MKIFFGKNVIHYIYRISVSVLSVTLSSDMKNFISVFYRYRPIRKLSLSGFIGIGRYEKKLIGRTLYLAPKLTHNYTKKHVLFQYRLVLFHTIYLSIIHQIKFMNF